MTQEKNRINQQLQYCHQWIQYDIFSNIYPDKIIWYVIKQPTTEQKNFILNKEMIAVVLSNPAFNLKNCFVSTLPHASYHLTASSPWCESDRDAVILVLSETTRTTDKFTLKRFSGSSVQTSLQQGLCLVTRGNGAGQRELDWNKSGRALYRDRTGELCWQD